MLTFPLLAVIGKQVATAVSSGGETTTKGGNDMLGVLFCVVAGRR
jgi:hypothetical protein